MHLQGANRLPAADMTERIGVPASTFRDWCATRTEILEPVRVVDDRIVEAVKRVAPPRIRSCGRDAAGRKRYRVTDARRARDTLRPVEAGRSDGRPPPVFRTLPSRLTPARYAQQHHER